MTLFIHELKRNKIALIIWSVAIAFMLAVCVLIYPEMSSQMGEISDVFASMGSFSAAFGMDQINFGEFVGFFAVECGNVLGLGGGFFAAITGVTALAKEEKDQTAEFLLTHPVSRIRVITQKLFAVLAQIIILNVIVIGVTAVSTLIIGETPDVKVFVLMFLAYFIMQVEIAAITFGISAFIRNGSVAIGLGLAVVFYFLNIVSNLTDDLKFIKYITPFGYTDGADIISNEAISAEYLLVGIVFMIVGIVVAYLRYTKKDI